MTDYYIILMGYDNYYLNLYAYNPLDDTIVSWGSSQAEYIYDQGFLAFSGNALYYVRKDNGKVWQISDMGTVWTELGTISSWDASVLGISGLNDTSKLYAVYQSGLSVFNYNIKEIDIATLTLGSVIQTITGPVGYNVADNVTKSLAGYPSSNFAVMQQVSGPSPIKTYLCTSFANYLLNISGSTDIKPITYVNYGPSGYYGYYSDGIYSLSTSATYWTYKQSIPVGTIRTFSSVPDWFLTEEGSSFSSSSSSSNGISSDSSISISSDSSKSSSESSVIDSSTSSSTMSSVSSTSYSSISTDSSSGMPVVDGLRYYSNFYDIASISNPEIGNNGSFVCLGSFDKDYDYNGYGLKKTKNNFGRIYCSDCSSLVSMQRGYIELTLSLPYNIVNGVHELIGDGFVDEYLVFGMNIGRNNFSHPSISVWFTDKGIEYIIWTSLGKYRIIDSKTSILSDTNFSLGVGWDSNGIYEHNGFTVVTVVNGVETIIANIPIASDNIDNVNLSVLDSGVSNFNMECTLRNLTIKSVYIIPSAIMSSSSSSFIDCGAYDEKEMIYISGENITGIFANWGNIPIYKYYIKNSVQPYLPDPRGNLEVSTTYNSITKILSIRIRNASQNIPGWLFWSGNSDGTLDSQIITLTPNPEITYPELEIGSVYWTGVGRTGYAYLRCFIPESSSSENYSLSSSSSTSNSTSSSSNSSSFSSSSSSSHSTESSSESSIIDLSTSSSSMPELCCAAGDTHAVIDHGGVDSVSQSFSNFTNMSIYSNYTINSSSYLTENCKLIFIFDALYSNIYVYPTWDAWYNSAHIYSNTSFDWSFSHTINLQANPNVTSPIVTNASVYFDNADSVNWTAFYGSGDVYCI